MGITLVANTAEAAAARPRLHEAFERIQAISEGRDLAQFLSDYDYTIELRALEAQAGLAPTERTLFLHQDLSATGMLLFLPHEGAHAVQFENCPDLLAFHKYIVQGDPVDVKGQLVLPRPRDFLWAMNAAEMAAYGVQTDFAYQLAARAGDKEAWDSYAEMSGPLARAYTDILHNPDVRQVKLKDYTLMDVLPQSRVAPDMQRQFAGALAARMWFWGTGDEQGRAAGLHYNDHMTEAMAQEAKSRVAPLFNAMAKGDVRPLLRRLTTNDVLRLGDCYEYNPLAVAGFDDIGGRAYRGRITPENDRRVRAVSRALSMRGPA